MGRDKNCKFLTSTILIILLMILSSCTSSRSYVKGIFKKRKGCYLIDAPKEKAFKQFFPKMGDLAWRSDDGAVLLLNSDCKSIKDIPLLGLAGELLIGFTQQKIQSKKLIKNSEREGLQVILTAKLDGVKQKLATFILKKNNCVYDLIYFAQPDVFERHLSAYKSTLASFKVENGCRE